MLCVYSAKCFPAFSFYNLGETQSSLADPLLVYCVSFTEKISQYSILATLFILLEVGLVAFIALDHHWEKVPCYHLMWMLVYFIFVPSFLTIKSFFQDIPFDPTGELDSLCTFIKDNVDVFEWVGIALVIIQAYFSPSYYLVPKLF